MAVVSNTGYKVIAILSCLLLSGFVSTGSEEYAPVDDLAQLVEMINASSSKTNTIHSGFIQKKHLEFLDETIVSRGQFWFRKENDLRWAYEEPFEYVIIIHGGKFYIKDGEKVSTYDMESNAVFREINELIVGMVQGTVMEQDRFEIEAFENDRNYLVKLVPRDEGMRGVISKMEVVVDKKDLTVSEMIMRESETDYTVITFIEKRLNESIPDAVFTIDF
jgi:outer membrane lipoprotein-sorting protein